MKKLWILVFITIILCVGLVLIIEYSGYKKIEVSDGILYGKLNNKNSDTVVLIIAGSGQTDMDGNSDNSNERNNSLLQLSNELAKKGISTFRYDKRTAGKSVDHFKNMTPDFNLFVDDCVASIKYLRDLGYNNIYIAGHSQGSLVGMLAALQEPIDGFISIAGAGKTIDLVLIEQFSQLYGEESDEIKIIKSLQDGKIDYTISEDNITLSPENQKFLMTWMAYNPVDIISQLDCRIMLIQGEEDLQVKIDDVILLAEACNEESLLIVPNMNHILKEINNYNENVASYQDPSFNIGSAVIDGIEDFTLGK